MDENLGPNLVDLNNKFKVIVAIGIIRLKPKNMKSDVFVKIIKQRFQSKYVDILKKVSQLENERLCVAQHRVLKQFANGNDSQYILFNDSIENAGDSCMLLSSPWNQRRNHSLLHDFNTGFLNTLSSVISKIASEESSHLIFIRNEYLYKTIQESVARFFSTRKIDSELPEKDNQCEIQIYRNIITLSECPFLDPDIAKMILIECSFFTQNALELYVQKRNRFSLKTMQAFSERIALLGMSDLFANRVTYLLVEQIRSCCKKLKEEALVCPNLRDCIYYLLQSLETIISSRECLKSERRFIFDEERDAAVKNALQQCVHDEFPLITIYISYIISMF